MASTAGEESTSEGVVPAAGTSSTIGPFEHLLNRAIWCAVLGFLARVATVGIEAAVVFGSPSLLFGGEPQDSESEGPSNLALLPLAGFLDIAALCSGCAALIFGGRVFQVSPPGSRERRWLTIVWLFALAAVLGTRVGCQPIVMF